MTLPNRLTATLMPAALLVMLLSGCGDVEPSGGEDSPERRLVIESLTAATALDYVVADYDALWHVLPNVSVTGGGMSGGSISDVTVVGRVTDVQPAHGYVARGDDGESVEVLDFQNPDAQWRTI